MRWHNDPGKDLKLFYDNSPVLGNGINLLNQFIDTLYIYEGSNFDPIGEDFITPTTFTPSATDSIFTPIPI